MVSILLVDDYDDIRAIMRRLLEDRGCRVIEAADGQEAVDHAVQHRPDLILMDLNLPTIDGFEAITMIKEQPDLAGVPVVAVSAQCWDPSLKQKATDAGCIACMDKPIDFDVLAELIQRLEDDLLPASTSNPDKERHKTGEKRTDSAAGRGQP